MHSKSDHIEIMIYDNADKVIREVYRYQSGWVRNINEK